MTRKSFAAGIILTAALVVLLSPACKEDPTSETLAASGEAFAKIESYAVLFEINVECDGQRTTVEGRAGYEGDALVYSEGSFSGDLSEQEMNDVLFIPPDLYGRMSNGDWYVLSPWNQGIRPDEMENLPLNDEIIGYSLVTEQLHDIERLPDQALNGEDYLRIAGIVDGRDLLSDSEFGFNDFSDMGVVLWLDKATLLPNKITLETSAGGANPDSSMDASIEFTQYNDPGALPERPGEARPWRDLEMGDPTCTGAELAACLEAQDELEAISQSSCDGSDRRVCLVPLGQVRPDLVQHLVDHYREEYGLTVTVLTPSAVPSEMVDPLREQVDAATLIGYIGRLFPDAYRDPDVVLIGLTAVDMYNMDSHYRYLFGLMGTQFDPKAVISTFRMDPAAYGEPADDELLFSRARKMFSRYVGLLYYGLAQSSEPGSPLYDSILGLSDLDNMTEPLPVPRPTDESEI
jgi:predicted Zn-dependent protease